MSHFQSRDEPSSPTESSLATSIFDSSSHSVSDADKRAAQIAKWRFSTLAANVDTKDQYGASSTPIYQTATFKGVNGEYDYTRSGNPTRGGLESHLARLYGAYSAFALSTGMTCLDMILRLVKPGETVLAGDDIYGGTNRLLTYLSTHGGVDVRHLDTTRPELLLPHLGVGNKVKMVLLESPTNPLLKIADLGAIAELVKSRAPGAIIVVDNTMMSPYLQRPLHLGADIVYDSGTKYLSGHHDVMAGVIAVKDEAVHKSIAFMINSVGSGLAPFDSFLLLRGVKTISLRMDRQMATAQLVADYLDALGFLVHYPGLKHHPQRDVHYKQATGAGAVLSFVTDDKALSERIVGGTRLWGISVSFGAVNSLISMPCMMSHASISAAVRAERGLPENLIRLCVGIEDPRDLIDDLEAALLSSGAIQHNLSCSPQNPTKVEAIFDTNPSAWILERARAFHRPGEESAMARLVQGVQRSLGLGEEERKSFEGEVVVSAPGKVILFGEHAVVHGVTAIATSVNLRCYAALTSRSDDKVALEVPNLGLEMEWSIKSLPWNLLPVSFKPSNRQIADKDLDGPLLEAIEQIVRAGNISVKSALGAAGAFLYLYMTIAGTETEAFSATFTASSNLPISAGLGSSAAYSTCIASSLLIAHKTISTPSSAFSPAETDLIDGWAFLSEKVLHGNPSGIDNAVSVRGGAVAFTRAMGGQPGGLEVLSGFDSVRLLLTNTLVGRDTKTLVAGVATLRAEQPELVEGILRSVQGISDEARGLLGGEVIERSRLIERLEALIKENHAHLVTLRVSHPSLETIVAATSRPPYNLSTKLTGAGGGGCAVTLIPDEFDQVRLEELMVQLRKDGFEPHLTSLGGKGAGVLKGQAPEGIVGEGEDRGVGVPLRAALREMGRDAVGAWAEGLGRWAYT